MCVLGDISETGWFVRPDCENSERILDSDVRYRFVVDSSTMENELRVFLVIYLEARLKGVPLYMLEDREGYLKDNKRNEYFAYS
ncbi:hypothetical protein [Neobacillus sp. SuZ13]|uniref:hypothetical protein n=1 Tax=Neobacillus sp. SuZ13 TaxID=3047875 RepID=UPI0024BFA537|nr:hypothetical protein [Neobacillus sp. SuZ13]WHY68813.1 hypothetical protein QNH17_09330 [Neobacillus sp. SuZ13]